jgi:putative ABC transport system ATP-binding protein
MKRKHPPTETAVQLSGLQFRWRAGAPVALDMDALTIKRAERVFVLGPSGSGKSTLLSLIAGVTIANHGKVTVLGQDMAALGGAERDHFRGDHVGMIFQMFNLIPYLSVLENVLLPCRFSTVRRVRATERGGDPQAEALRLLSHLDMDDTELLARPVTELSVGQQQRVAAARALIGAPQIVLADEPTSALDTDRREAFVKLLFKECAAEGITLLFVSHDMTLKPLFDRSITLNAQRRGRSAA